MECPSCERECPASFMSKHHLRTRKVDKHNSEHLCRDCHGFIHALFTNAQLADPTLGLDTLEGLLGNEEYRRAVTFIRKLEPGRKVAIRESNGRKRRRGSRGG